MIKNLLIIGLTFFNFYAKAQSFSVTYGFPELTTSTGSIDPSFSPTLTGVDFSAFHAFGTSTNPNASARFSFTGWPVGAVSADDNYGNYTAVLSPTIFYEVKLSVDPGYTLNLTELNFDVRRSGTGIRTYCVRSSLDNFTNNLSAATGTNANLTVIPGEVFFWKYDSIPTTNDQKSSKVNFDASFSALTSSLALRFYAWNAEANGGSFSLDNVNFVGIISNSNNTAGIEDLNTTSKKMTVYPNPCNTGMLKIKTEAKCSSIQMIDINGRVCHSEIYWQPSNEIELKISELPAGIYVLKVAYENGSEYTSIIIDPK